MESTIAPVECSKCGVVSIWPKRMGTTQFQEMEGGTYHAMYYGGDFGFWCGPLKEMKKPVRGKRKLVKP